MMAVHTASKLTPADWVPFFTRAKLRTAEFEGAQPRPNRQDELPIGVHSALIGLNRINKIASAVAASNAAPDDAFWNRPVPLVCPAA